MNEGELVRLVSARMREQEHRVFPVEHEGRVLWVKRAERVAFKVQCARLAQRLIQGTTRIEALRPARLVGGAAGIRGEIAAMRELRSRGARVPTVVAVAPDHAWFAMESLGESLGKIYHYRPEEGHRHELLRGAASALADFHSQGLVHGAPVLRNIVHERDGAAERFGFIDFECHPGDSMPLDAAQARDFLWYLWSATHFLHGDESRAAALIDGYRRFAPAHVWPQVERIKQFLDRTDWLLRPFRLRSGSDLRRLASTRKALARTVTRAGEG